MRRLSVLMAATALMATSNPAEAAPADATRNIVLVHGAFADGSGWEPVATLLRADGYNVSIVQEPETSLEADVTATNRILDMQSGKAVLVGHSYGGAVITEAGKNAHVSALVYVAAFVPDAGEKIGPLTGSMPPAAKSIKPTADGYLLIDRAQFAADFAADLPRAKAEFMASSQVPINGQIFDTPLGNPAWKTKTTYGIVATQDRMINPALQRFMYQRAHAKVTEVKGSHVIFISQPRAVADVIERAARESK